MIAEIETDPLLEEEFEIADVLYTPPEPTEEAPEDINIDDLMRGDDDSDEDWAEATFAISCSRGAAINRRISI